MPSAEPPKRPGLPHRHSAGSVSFAKSPHETNLSSSVSKQKSTRFVVGQGRLGNRNSSYGKNLNKLSRLTPARAPAPEPSPTSPKPGHVKHNSSNVLLDRSQSATVLRKNHSETSLKKNRSSGHLTKLARPSSSRNVAAKALKTRQKRSRSSVSNIKLPDGPANPTVRFDLGHQDDDYGGESDDQDDDDDGSSWAYTDSRSPSTTRSSTRRNSVISPSSKSPKAQSKENLDPTDRPPSASPDSPAATSASARSHEADSITSRLLKRNVSFNIAPQVTSNPAHPVMIDPREPVAHSHNTLNDSSNPEVVSRFLSQGTSTSGPSHESSFLPRHPAPAPAPTEAHTQPSSAAASPEKEPPDAANSEGAPRRNKSMPSFSDEYVSRTQQRLNLERESAEAEAPVAPPRTLLHVSRLSSASIPFRQAPAPSLAMHVRQLADRTSVEYRRVRLYQNPLVDAAQRLRAAGLAPRMGPRAAATAAAARAAPANAASDPKAPGQSQSLRSSQRGGGGGGKPLEARRPRVMFQGVNDGADDERAQSRGSVDGADEDAPRTQRDAIRDLCERLWAQNDTAGAGGDGGGD